MSQPARQGEKRPEKPRRPRPGYEVVVEDSSSEAPDPEAAARFIREWLETLPGEAP